MKTNNKREKEHHYVLWTIRALLIISVLYNLIQVTAGSYKHERDGIFIELLLSRLELILWAAFTFLLTYLHDFFETKNIHLPGVLEVILLLYIFAGIFLSAYLDLFYRFFWWDMLLHTFSGVFLGFMGFLGIYKINMRHSMNISPFFAAAFAFGFSVSLNVLFEIYEFSIDVVFGTALQSWDLPERMLDLGKPFQGSGLRDTMSDLICDTAGALTAAVYCFYLYKNKKRKTLKMMKEMFPPPAQRAES